jgi:hypothetical protein
MNFFKKNFNPFFLQTTTSTLPTAPSEFVTEMQELHTSLEKCSKFVISVQAECAMTTDVKFLFELEKFMGDILPLESQAHTWHSELFYRFVLDCV